MVVVKLVDPIQNYDSVILEIRGTGRDPALVAWDEHKVFTGGAWNKHFYYNNDTLLFMVDRDTLVIYNENIPLSVGYYIGSIADGTVDNGFDFHLVEYYADLPDLEAVESGETYTVLRHDNTNMAGTYEATEDTWKFVACLAPSIHSALSQLDEDDHSHYHNDIRGDARYYKKTEYIDGYTLVSGEHPIKTSQTTGKIGINIIPGGLDHGSMTGLSDDDHSHYIKTDGTRSMDTGYTPAVPLSVVTKGYLEDYVLFNIGSGNYSIKADYSDAAPGYLNDKIEVAGSLSKSIVDVGGDRSVKIETSSTLFDTDTDTLDNVPDGTAKKGYAITGDIGAFTGSNNDKSRLISDGIAKSWANTMDQNRQEIDEFKDMTILVQQTIDASVHDLVYFNTSTNKWEKADIDHIPQGMYVADFQVTLQDGTTTYIATNCVITNGRISTLSGLTPGSYYMDNSGNLTTTKTRVSIGHAISSTEFILDIQVDQKGLVLYQQTAESSVDVGKCVYYKPSASRWELSDSSNASLGLVISKTDGKIDVAISGVVDISALGLARGQIYYMDMSTRGLTTSITAYKIGYTISTTEMNLDIEVDQEGLVSYQQSSGTGVVVERCVYFDTATSSWELSDSSNSPIGLVIRNDAGMIDVAINGIVDISDLALSDGEVYYMDPTDGSLTTTENRYKIGFTISTTEMVLNIEELPSAIRMYDVETNASKYDCVYYDNNDTRWEPASFANPPQGVLTNTNIVTISGKSDGFTSLTPNTTYYMDSSGSLTTTKSDIKIGYAINSTTMLINIDIADLSKYDVVINSQSMFESYFGTGSETGSGTTPMGWSYTETGGTVTVIVPKNTSILLKSNPDDGSTSHFKYDATNYNWKAYQLNTMIQLSTATNIHGEGIDQSIVTLSDNYAGFTTTYLDQETVTDISPTGYTFNVFTVDDGTNFQPGQTVDHSTDNEFYKVINVSGNDVTVDRAITGSGYDNLSICQDSVAMRDFTIDGRCNVDNLGGSRTGRAFDLNYCAHSNFEEKVINCYDTNGGAYDGNMLVYGLTIKNVYHCSTSGRGGGVAYCPNSIIQQIYNCKATFEAGGVAYCPNSIIQQIYNCRAKYGGACYRCNASQISNIYNCIATTLGYGGACYLCNDCSFTGMFNGNTSNNLKSCTGITFYMDDMTAVINTTKVTNFTQ